MAGNDKTHPIADEWGRIKNFDFCAEEEPTTTWPYMVWIQPSTGSLKVRNWLDTEWVSLATADHGQLVGLLDDDHPQYSPVSGARPFTGEVTFEAGIAFDAPSGSNLVTFPTGQAAGLKLLDTNLVEYLQIDTDPQLEMIFNGWQADIDIFFNANGVEKAVAIRGSDGAFTAGGLDPDDVLTGLKVAFNIGFSAQRITNSAAGPSFEFYKARGSAGSPANIQAYDELGGLTWRGYAGGNDYSARLFVDVLTVVGDNIPGRFRFQTTDTGDDTNFEDCFTVSKYGIIVNTSARDIDFIVYNDAGSKSLFLDGADGLATMAGPSLGVGDGWWIGNAAGPKVTFDSGNNYLEIVSCEVFVDPSNTISAPDGTFHVHTASAGAVTANGSFDDLVVENTSVGISLLFDSEQVGGLIWGTGGSTVDSVYHAIVVYGADHASYADKMRIFVANANRLWIDGSGNGYPGGNKTQDWGLSGTAWRDVWAETYQLESDFFLLDHRQTPEGEIVPVDDLAVICGIRGSGRYDPRSGMEVIDDDTLPRWMLTRDAETGETLYCEDGKPWVSNVMMFSLLIGTARQLAQRLETLEARIS